MSSLALCFDDEGAVPDHGGAAASLVAAWRTRLAAFAACRRCTLLGTKGSIVISNRYGRPGKTSGAPRSKPAIASLAHWPAVIRRNCGGPPAIPPSVPAT